MACKFKTIDELKNGLQSDIESKFESYGTIYLQLGDDVLGKVYKDVTDLVNLSYSNYMEIVSVLTDHTFRGSRMPVDYIESYITTTIEFTSPLNSDPIDIVKLELDFLFDSFVIRP